MNVVSRRAWFISGIAVVATGLVISSVVVAVRFGGGGTAEPPPPRPTAPTSASAEPTLTTSERPPTVTTTRAPPRITTTVPRPPATAPFPPGLAGQDIIRLPTSKRIVAVTFDAGANAAGLPSILATLKRTGVAATFYLTGRFADDHPSAGADIAAAGHRVGNHSQTHPHFTQLSNAQIAAELSSAYRAIRASGADPRPLFRFPFGDRDNRTICAVNAAGYLPVRWTVDTLGWQGTTEGMTEQKVLDRVLATLRPGQIVLMHVGSHPKDGSTLDADALPEIISAVRDRGYSFVTLDALLR